MEHFQLKTSEIENNFNKIGGFRQCDVCLFQIVVKTILPPTTPNTHLETVLKTVNRRLLGLFKKQKKLKEKKIHLDGIVFFQDAKIKQNT